MLDTPNQEIDETWFEELSHAPVYRPSLAQWSDAVTYIESIRDEASTFGAREWGLLLAFSPRYAPK